MRDLGREKGLCGVTGGFSVSISFSKAIAMFGTLSVYC